MNLEKHENAAEDTISQNLKKLSEDRANNEATNLLDSSIQSKVNGSKSVEETATEEVVADKSVEVEIEAPNESIKGEEEAAELQQTTEETEEAKETEKTEEAELNVEEDTADA